MNAEILKCSSSGSFFATYEFIALYLQMDAMYFTMQQVMVMFGISLDKKSRSFDS